MSGSSCGGNLAVDPEQRYHTDCIRQGQIASLVADPIDAHGACLSLT
jgi:hypothetical protein